MTDSNTTSSETTDDRGVIMAGVVYTCRVCGNETKVYVSPVLRDGKPTLDFDSRHRLVQCRCQPCGVDDRTHVAKVALNR